MTPVTLSSARSWNLSLDMLSKTSWLSTIGILMVVLRFCTRFSGDTTALAPCTDNGRFLMFNPRYRYTTREGQFYWQNVHGNSIQKSTSSSWAA